MSNLTKKIELITGKVVRPRHSCPDAGIASLIQFDKVWFNIEHFLKNLKEESFKAFNIEIPVAGQNNLTFKILPVHKSQYFANPEKPTKEEIKVYTDILLASMAKNKFVQGWFNGIPAVPVKADSLVINHYSDFIIDEANNIMIWSINIDNLIFLYSKKTIRICVGVKSGKQFYGTVTNSIITEIISDGKPSTRAFLGTVNRDGIVPYSIQDAQKNKGVIIFIHKNYNKYFETAGCLDKDNTNGRIVLHDDFPKVKSGYYVPYFTLNEITRMNSIIKENNVPVKNNPPKFHQPVAVVEEAVEEITAE